MSNALKEFYEALDRLSRGTPIRVPPSTRITNDAVSLEAGRKKGAIKRSRHQHVELIAAIKVATLNRPLSTIETLQLRLQEAKTEAATYRAMYEEGLVREVSLLKELNDLQGKLLANDRQKVRPLSGRDGKAIERGD
ncbi:hypothetical protein [Achromobacter animicus]|uniref:hypothetical protein n=1 Tax=Achromobacter animicus TaxID=1389935 RepID=UPI00345EF4FB